MEIPITLPARFRGIATEAKVTFDLSLLGPRQKSEFLRMARTGFLKGTSVSQGLALYYRRKYKLPIIHSLRYSGIRWENANTSTHETLNAVAVAQRMVEATIPKEDRSWHMTYYKPTHTKLLAGYSYGEVYGLHAKAKKAATKSNLGSHPDLEDFLKQVESGAITTLTAVVKYR
jgi:hypothetical protein